MSLGTVLIGVYMGEPMTTEIDYMELTEATNKKSDYRHDYTAPGS